MSISIRHFFTFALAALIALAPEMAAAGGAPATFGQTICNVVKLITDDVGKALATLAIIFLGIGAFFGKVNWGLAVMVAVGIAAIFGAAAIADFVAGNGQGC